MQQEPAEAVIIDNLIEALERLRQDLDRVELWAAALGTFQSPVPQYRPPEKYLLRADRTGPDDRRGT